MTRWWFQPLWKILVKLERFPRVGVKHSFFETTIPRWVVAFFWAFPFPVSPWRQTCLEHIHPSYPRPPQWESFCWPFNVIIPLFIKSPPYSLASHFTSFFVQELKPIEPSLPDKGSPLLRTFKSFKFDPLGSRLQDGSLFAQGKLVDMFVTSASIKMIPSIMKKQEVLRSLDSFQWTKNTIVMLISSLKKLWMEHVSYQTIQPSANFPVGTGICSSFPSRPHLWTYNSRSVVFSSFPRLIKTFK